MTILDAALVQRLRAFLEAGKGAAWLTGHPGSGMTRMVEGLAEQLDMQPVWTTASQRKTRAFLRDVCSCAVAVDGRRKLLVLDELDVVLGNETAMLDVSCVVKRPGQVPVVCILKTSRSSKSHDLRKKAALCLDFPPPSADAMCAVALQVIAEEGLATMAPASVMDMCLRAPPGDLRHVLQTLRAQTPAAEIRSAALQTADAVAAVYGSDFDEAMRLYWAEPGAVSSGVFESYTQAASTVEEAARIAEFGSVADVVDETMHSRCHWDLLDMYGCLTVAPSAVLLPKTSVKLERYGVVWNQEYAKCTKAKMLRELSRVGLEVGNQPLGRDGVAFLQQMLPRLLEDRERCVEVCKGLGLRAEDVLKVMRLWNTGYKLALHNRTVKKWL